MGFINHHAIIVTSWDLDDVRAAHAKALELQANVSSLVPYIVNSGASFMVAPDGSNEGWEDSAKGDTARDQLFVWMAEHGKHLDYVEVEFSPDADRAGILRTNCKQGARDDDEGLGVTGAEPPAGPSAVSLPAVGDAAAVPNASPTLAPVGGGPRPEILCRGLVPASGGPEDAFRIGRSTGRSVLHADGRLFYMAPDEDAARSVCAALNLLAGKGQTHKGVHEGSPWGVSARSGNTAPDADEPDPGRILGYFTLGPLKWLLTERKDGMLKGFDVTPMGKVHTMHMAESLAHVIVMINDDDYCLACWNTMPVGETCAVCGRVNTGNA